MKSRKFSLFLVLFGLLFTTPNLMFASNTKDTSVERVSIDLVYRDFKNVMSNVTDKTDTILVHAANNITKGASYFWDVLVRQQKVNAWYIIFEWLLSLFCIYRSVKYIFKFWNMDKVSDDKNYLPWIVVCIVWLCFGAIGAGYSSFYMNDAFTGIFNPEYGAMRELYSIGSSIWLH